MQDNQKIFNRLINNKLLPFFIIIFLFILVFLLWRALENREDSLRIKTINNETQKIIEIINVDFDNRIKSLQRIINRWEVRGGTPKNEFLKDTQSYIEDNPGYQALSWVDKSYHVRWIEPLKGNESAVNLNLAFEENRRIALEKAKKRRLPTLTAPIDLVQGGKGFLVYFPIYVNEEFEGFLTAVFRTQKWLNHVLNDKFTQKEKLSYLNLVSMDEQLIYKTEDWTNKKESPLSIESKTMIYGHEFTIKSSPTNFFMRESHSLLPELVFLVGIVFSLLLSLIVYLIQRANKAVKRTLISKKALEKEIIERKKIEKSLITERQRLASILEGTNVGTWEWNVQTGETIFNERWANIVGYTLKELEPISIETWLKLAHPDDLKISSELIAKHFDGELDYYEFESRMKHKDGRWVWVLDRGKIATFSKDGKPLLMSGTHKEITKQKENEEKIRHLATHDDLTDLPTLRLAKDRFLMAIEISKRNNTFSAIIFIDLDGFKNINDTYGHDVGDVLLKEISKRLLSCARKTDTVSRIGGDEFLMIISDFDNKNLLISIAQKLIESISKPIVFKELQLMVGASIGISVYPDDSNSCDKLIKLADEAMYASKNSGKNRFTFVKDI